MNQHYPGYFVNASETGSTQNLGHQVNGTINLEDNPNHQAYQQYTTWPQTSSSQHSSGLPIERYERQEPNEGPWNSLNRRYIQQNTHSQDTQNHQYYQRYVAQDHTASSNQIPQLSTAEQETVNALQIHQLYITNEQAVTNQQPEQTGTAQDQGYISQHGISDAEDHFANQRLNDGVWDAEVVRHQGANLQNTGNWQAYRYHPAHNQTTSSQHGMCSPLEHFVRQTPKEGPYHPGSVRRGHQSPRSRL